MTNKSTTEDAVKSDKAERDKRQTKLDKINAYDAASPGFFGDIAGLEANINTGLSLFQSGLSSFNGSFTIPSKGQLTWAKSINSEYKQYQNYQSAVNKAKKGEELTDKDVQVLTAYAQSHPNEKTDSKVIDAIKDYINKIKEHYDEHSTEYDVYANIVEQLGLGVQRIGGLVTVLEGIEGPATVDANGVSTSFVLVNENGVGQSIAAKGSKIASVGKWGGRALMGLGFGLGMFDDMVNKDKTVGQAVVHNGLSTGLSWGAGTAAAALVFGTNPVGWAAVGAAAVAFGVGTAVSWAFNKAYDNNFLGPQDGLDAAGDWLDDAGKSVGKAVSKGIDSAKNWAKNTADSVGDAVSGGISALNPFD